MTAKISYDEVEVGTELPTRSFPVNRATLVQYAGASGDFNPIHWNEKFARRSACRTSSRTACSPWPRRSAW